MNRKIFKIIFIVLLFPTVFIGCSNNHVEQTTDISEIISNKDDDFISVYFGEDDNFKAIYIQCYDNLDIENNSEDNINYGAFYLISKATSFYNDVEISLLGNVGEFIHEEQELNLDSLIYKNLNLINPHLENNKLTFSLNNISNFELLPIE